MAEFLSAEWLSELSAAAGAASAPADLRLVVQQVLLGDDGTELAAYAVRITDGVVQVIPGRAPDADVTSGPGDPTIGSRSPSSDPERVAEQVVAAAAGFAESEQCDPHGGHHVIPPMLVILSTIVVRGWARCPARRPREEE